MKSTTSFATHLVGTLAHDFSLKDGNGVVCSLASLKGKKVALIFLPKQKTSYSGSKNYTTKFPASPSDIQLWLLGEKHSELKEAGITVVVISDEFPRVRGDHGIPYNLISKGIFTLLRADSTVLKNYSVSGSILTSLPSIPKRHTFLINEQGRVVAVIQDVNIETHAEQIMHKFAKSTLSSSEKTVRGKDFTKKLS